MRRSLVCAVVLSVLGSVPTPTTAAAAPVCTPTVLPSPSGGTVVRMVGTDGAGTYVGVANDGIDDFGVRWRNGQVERLPQNFVPSDMNRSGVTAGSVELDSSVVAALMAPDGTITRLAAGHSAGAAGLNDRGDAVGWLYPEHPTTHLTTLWRAGSREYEVLDDGWFVPGDIDDNGLSFGYKGANSERQRVWDLDGNVLREFGPYGENDVRLELADIDDGRLAVTRVEPTGRTQVVVMDVRPGRYAALPGSLGGYASAMENSVVVGTGPQGAMLWRLTSATVLPAPDGMRTREASVVDSTGTEAAGVSLTPVGDPVATLWRCH